MNSTITIIRDAVRARASQKREARAVLFNATFLVMVPALLIGTTILFRNFKTPIAAHGGCVLLESRAVADRCPSNIPCTRYGGLHCLEVAVASFQKPLNTEVVLALNVGLALLLLQVSLLGTPSMVAKPVFRSLNKPMTLLGVERRLFFFILVVSFSLFHLSSALLPALALFGVLWMFARAATQADPHLLRILLNSSKFVARYDPAHRGKGRGPRD